MSPPLAELTLLRVIIADLHSHTSRAIILFFWVNLTVAVSPLIPATSHYVLDTPYLTFTSIMACKVFRGVALGVLEESPSTAKLGLSTTSIAAAFELAPVPTERGASSKVP